MSLRDVILKVNVLLMTGIGPASSSTGSLHESLYLFDVTCLSSQEPLKWDPSGVDIRHSFKVDGADRYLFVVVNDNSDLVNQLTFPRGCGVEQYPIEHAARYFDAFGVTGWPLNDSSDLLTGPFLTLVQMDLLFDADIPVSEFNAQMAAYGDYYKTGDQVARVVYGVNGHYPPKFFYFLNPSLPTSLGPYDVGGLDTVGGPPNVQVVSNSLVKV